MSSDNSEVKFNRKQSDSDTHLNRENVIKNEVQRLFKKNANKLSYLDIQNLRKKYKDEEIVDQINDLFTEKVHDIRKKARKFVKLMVNKYGVNNHPLHVILRKALKYKKKYEYTDSEFEEFKRNYEKLLLGNGDTSQTELDVPYTNMGRVLGQPVVDVESGMNISDKDFEYVQKLLRLYTETKTTHSQVVLQSMTYQDCAIESLYGEYVREKHNPHCHIHPVIAALFIPKFEILDRHMLLSNMAYIVKQKYMKQPILTSEDYDLFYSLISDPNDIVCSNESPIIDLYNRSQLQNQLYNSVLSLRNGRYYDCSNHFMIAIDNCRRTEDDSPDLIYEGDEGTVLKRLLTAFSLRPTIVATTPFMPSYAINNMNVQTRVIPRVMALPFVTLKLNHIKSYDDVVIDLKDALSMSQTLIEDGNFVVKNQEIIYSREILIFYVPRRSQTLNIKGLVQPYNFTKLPKTIAGFDRLDNRQINVPYDIDLTSKDQHFTLKSVVITNVATYDNSNFSSNNLITGSSTIIRKIEDNGLVSNLWYNPVEAGKVKYSDMETKYQQIQPITHLNASEDDLSESFMAKASTRGTIFVYKMDTKSEFPNYIYY